MNAMDLPQSTVFGRILPKERFYTNSVEKERFTREVERIRWANKISPETINIAGGEKVGEIEVIEVTLTVVEPDKCLLQALHRAIPYKCIFVMNGEHYTVFYDDKISYTANEPPKLLGTNIDVVWDNIVRQIGGLPFEDTPLTEQIERAERLAKLKKEIAVFERKARTEKQPRRKLDYAEQIKKLKSQLGE